MNVILLLVLMKDASYLLAGSRLYIGKLLHRTEKMGALSSL